MQPEMSRAFFTHYEGGIEAPRLFRGSRLEYDRSVAILERFLPRPPAVICDVGGGPGAYAFWAAGRGCTVHLLDVVPLHIEQARAEADRTGVPLASLQVGDARDLPYADASADAVLLMGPLYHLVRREERVSAWREAARVVRPGGVVIAAAISRYASMLDGIRHGWLADADFSAIVDRDLRDGQHRNPADNPAWFTTAYFHTPDELAPELTDAGLRHTATLAVEGPAWLIDNAADLSAPERQRLLTLLAEVESAPSLLGASAHLLAIGRKE